MQFTAKQNIYTVTRLNQTVKDLLQCHFLQVWVKGEISNLTKAVSGHWYFKIKDHKAQVQCAMFKGANRKVSFNVKEGDEILIRASVSLYEPRGDYQLIVEHMESAGEGELLRAYEQLKYKLAAEGLFAEQNKQALPKTINRVGIVTSSTGAAVHDILTVLNRRSPNTEVIIYPTQVQGETASQQIIEAVMLANDRNEVDVLIVGRGGGSIEDLWCFNNEFLAHAIFNSAIPVVSAVGHEVDTTIIDFVADVRAPTPSAAAELVSQDTSALSNDLTNKQIQLSNGFKQYLLKLKHRLAVYETNLAKHDPKYQLASQQQMLDDMSYRLHSALSHSLNSSKNTLTTLEKKLQRFDPALKLSQYQNRLSQYESRLHQANKQQLNDQQQKISILAAKLHAYSPLATLSRGYSITKTPQGSLINSVTQTKPAQEILIQLADGTIDCTINHINAE